MFTGLVETTGSVVSLNRDRDVLKLRLSVHDLAEQIYLGQSISVSGVCLTVTDIEKQGFSLEIIPETAQRTTLGRLTVGRRVNLERALRADSRLDGHIVTGHIDGIGTIEKILSPGRTKNISISASSSILQHVVQKGSIALDGISLTVIEVSDTMFTVGVIPTTLADTTLGSASMGDDVNIETDIIAKYVNKLITSRESQTSDERVSGVTWDTLSGMGWTSG